MMKSKSKDKCKAICRLLVDMLYEGRNSTRNLSWIHRNYAEHLSGVKFETFSSYLDSENDPLDDVEIPPHIVIGLWLMVKVPRSARSLPEDLRRRLASAKHTRARYVRRRRPKSASACCEPKGECTGSRSGNDESREAEEMIRTEAEA